MKCKELLDIVNLMPDKGLTFSLRKEFCVKSGQTKMSLQAMDADECYIAWPEEETVAEVELAEVIFKDLINAVVYSTEKNDTNSHQPVKSAVRVTICDDILTMMATDGHRIVKNSSKIKPTGVKQECLIPASQLVDVASMLSDRPGDNMRFLMTKTGYRIKTSYEESEICGKTVKANYPNFSTFLTKKTNNLIVVDREQLYKSTERCNYVSKKDGYNTAMLLDIGNTLRIYSRNTLYGVEDEICCNIKGTPMQIGINPAYLREMLMHYPDEKVRIGYSSPTEPIILYTDEDEQTLVVLPIALH